MDVKQYFRKLREIESSLTESYPLVVSLETSDGGKPGLVSEVSRATAAKLIVEGRAILADDKARAEYREHQAAAKKAAEKSELAKRVQIAIISEPEVQTTSTSKKNSDQSSSGK